MKQLLSPLCAAALLAASLSAQCYETNLGTQIGTGDDTLFAVQPLGFTFPMGGIAATYDAVQFNTNGVAFLTNGTTAAVGGTGTGYSTVAATQLKTCAARRASRPASLPCGATSTCSPPTAERSSTTTRSPARR